MYLYIWGPQPCKELSPHGRGNPRLAFNPVIIVPVGSHILDRVIQYETCGTHTILFEDQILSIRENQQLKM